MNISDIFIQNIVQITPEDIPEDVYFQAKRCLIDYLGVLFAGAALYKKSIKEEVLSVNDPYSSALVKGFCSHILELDDGHRKGAVPVGGTIFSALLSVAEHEDISYQDLLYGAIIGYEATIRLACAVQPGNKLRGYHATGTCGTIGAALAIAAALHFNSSQMKTTLSASQRKAKQSVHMLMESQAREELQVV